MGNVSACLWLASFICAAWLAQKLPGGKMHDCWLFVRSLRVATCSRLDSQDSWTLDSLWIVPLLHSVDSLWIVPLLALQQGPRITLDCAAAGSASAPALSLLVCTRRRRIHFGFGAGILQWTISEAFSGKENKRLHILSIGTSKTFLITLFACTFVS